MHRALTYASPILTIMCLLAANSHGQDQLIIDFDELSAPCDFASAAPLREEYAALGIHFLPWEYPEDGAPVLGDCSGLGVPGYSASNFLAVDSSQTMLNDGAASGPIFFQFDEQPYSVTVAIGGPPGVLAHLDCRLPWGLDPNYDEVVLTDSMATLRVSSSVPLPSSGCFIDAEGEPFIVDDLVVSFQQPAAPIPADGTASRIALVLAIAAAGLFLLKHRCLR